MAKKDFFHGIDFNQNAICNVVVDPVAATPTAPAPVPGQIYYNTVTNRLVVMTPGGVECEIACLADIIQESRFISDHDASTGIPAGAGINAGDYWRVSVGGTIVGQASGDDVLEPGDMVFALVNNPSTPADFFSIQVNTDLPTNINVCDEQVIASIPANTPTAVTSPAISRLCGWHFLDATGQEIELCVTRTAAGTLTVESNVALSNITALLSGVA